MSKAYNDSKQYSAKDIQDYLNGQLTAREMNILEKAALEDPFLADAIEGFSSLQHDEHTRNLAGIREKLGIRTKKTIVVPFYKRPLTQAVAAFLLLAIGLSLAYTLLSDKKTSLLAINKQEKAGTSNVEKQGSLASTDSIAPGTTEPAPSLKDGDMIALDNKKPSPALKYSVDRGNTTFGKANTSPDTLREKPASALPRSLEKETENKDRARQYDFSAEAQSAAPVHAKPATNRLDSLSDSKSLDDVVVVGYGIQKKKQTLSGKVAGVIVKEVADTAAVPIGGMSAYKEYLTKNKQVPAGQENMHGDVIVHFKVKRSGKVTDIKIVRSLSPELDKEAIRLVKEGPEWKRSAKGKNNTSVTITF